MNSADNILLEKIILGDSLAFTELINKYKDKIYYLGYRMLGNKEEAEDICQETFIRVYSNLNKYDSKHKFSTWVYKIATNLCIDRIRKNKQKIYSLDNNYNSEDELNGYSKLPDKKIMPEDQLILDEKNYYIQQSFNNLPVKYRTIMILRYIDELPLQEICNIVELPLTTVKTRLHRGREYMRKSLLDNDIFKERG
ncbi:MAG: RNA polymerase sigma factor SigW [Vulcanibacillus sp.]